MNRLLRVAVLALSAGFFALAVHVDFPLCPMASSFGIPCPGCGLTRAALALLHGDVRRALQFHPLIWLLGPLFIAFVGAALLELLRKPASKPGTTLVSLSGRGTNIVAVCVLVLSLSVWLARFAGYFGGPVQVTSLREWVASRYAGEGRQPSAVSRQRER